MQNITAILAAELGCAEKYVENVAALLDEGNTIPFIARYRKEAHGGMDDTMLRTLETRLQYLRNLQARRAEVKELIAGLEGRYPDIKQKLFGSLQRYPLYGWNLHEEER